MLFWRKSLRNWRLITFFLKWESTSFVVSVTITHSGRECETLLMLLMRLEKWNVCKQKRHTTCDLSEDHKNSRLPVLFYNVNDHRDDLVVWLLIVCCYCVIIFQFEKKSPSRSNLNLTKSIWGLKSGESMSQIVL